LGAGQKSVIADERQPSLLRPKALFGLVRKALLGISLLLLMLNSVRLP
jgi:hypothetical protein